MVTWLRIKRIDSNRGVGDKGRAMLAIMRTHEVRGYRDLPLRSRMNITNVEREESTVRD